MKKQCLHASFTVLVLLTTFLFAGFNVAESEQTLTDTLPQKSEDTPVIPNSSILNLIPKETLGVIYCPNILEADNRINALITELAPESEPFEIPAKALAHIFPAELLTDIFVDKFEGLTDFEKIGLDLNQGFAIFITSLQPLHLSALMRLKDAEAMKRVFEAEGSTPTEYKGVTYWNTTKGNQSFAMLEDTLVFSTPHGVCESVIDTYTGTRQTITQNPNYSVFLTDILEGSDQLGVCFDIEGIIATFDRPLEEELEAIVDTVMDGDDEASKAIAPFLDDIPEKDIESIEKLQSISARLEIEGTDIQIKPFLKLRNDSEFLKTLEEVSGELAFLNELPNRAAINGAVHGCPKLLVELSEFLLATFPQKTPEQQAQRDCSLSR